MSTAVNLACRCNLGHGITRALIDYDATLKSALSQAGFADTMHVKWSVRRSVCTRTSCKAVPKR